jgi:hypothetical protein
MRAVLAGALLAVGLVACGGGSGSADQRVIRAGQVDIQLPDGWRVTKDGAVRPPTPAANTRSTAPAGGIGSPGSAPADTVPLAQEDPTTKFFKAVTTFQTCLRDSGTKWLGIPDQSKPDSPANDPDYIKSLSTCAAKSNIVQALQDQQKAQDAMTPAEIEEQNKGYLKWRDCMVGRGWGIPKPKPDAKGRLFSFGGASSGPPAFDPPPGQDLFSSSDLSDCANEVQRATSRGTGG